MVELLLLILLIQPLQTSFSNVLGQADFTSYSASITQSTIYAGAVGIAVDIKNNKLYVGNTGAKRILVFGASQTIDFKKLHTYSNILFIRLNIFDNSNNVNYLVSDKIVTE